MDDHDYKLRAAWAILLSASAYLLKDQRNDVDACAVLGTALMDIGSECLGQGPEYIVHWLVWAEPRQGRANYAHPVPRPAQFERNL
jgi:hypothetical protein